MSDPTPAARCPNCGAVLPPGTTDCVSCLFERAADATSIPASASSSRLPSADPMSYLIGERPSTEATVLEEGQTFGPYRIGRLLGRGGMGEVYEAEHIQHGRRVALKVLNQRLRRADDRERFLQEGQLAAAVNHPNTVYIFSSEEVNDVPVITMELLPGGTLKDHVKANGALQPPEAVDAILQVVAGLEAAQAGGILHRDVKPSNCFVAGDGTVKVGDFGLSISSLPRHVTTLAESGAFQGTPEYAAPEQLRGEKLDVRADIYSVGATLFYLLTAHPLFEDQNRQSLVTKVSTAPVPSARRIQPAIPRELDRLVTRCLAKDKDARFATYAELSDALRPFRSASLKPAPVGPRVLASAVGIAIPVVLAGFVMGPLVGFRIIRDPVVAFVTVLFLPIFAIGSLWEGRNGASWNQSLCGVRVVALNGGRHGVGRAVLRRALLVLPCALVWILFHEGARWMPNPSTVAHALTLPLSAGALGLVFSTARRRTGFVGLHDRLTRTRVVEKPPVNPSAPPTIEAAPPVEESGHRMGPYERLTRLGSTWEGTLYLAFDPRLKRSVWLHVYKSETPELPPAARAVSRPARLHWLNGHRAPGVDGSWDAYEAVDGKPFAVDPGRPSWHVVGQWLLAIARECEASASDRSLDVVGTKYLWIAADGRLKILPFRAPGVQTLLPDAHVRHVAGVIEVLRAVVSLTTSPQPGPLRPLPAATCLESLAWPAIASLGDLVRAVEALTDVPDRVTRGTRAAGIGVSLLVYYFGSGVLGRVFAPGVNLTADALQIPMHLTPAVVGVVWTAWLSVLAAASLCSGVCLYASRIAVVTADGREASPLRAAARAAIVWSWPLIHLWAVTHGLRPLTSALDLVAVAAIIWAIVSPARGLQDYLADTYLVPR
jgi:eukaryotic-like serine/threonine-protein kinase